MAIDGKSRRMGSRIGSVARCKNWTMGLNGSGDTQLIKALIRISQYITVKIILTKYAKALIKLLITNINKNP